MIELLIIFWVQYANYNKTITNKKWSEYWIGLKKDLILQNTLSTYQQTTDTWYLLPYYSNYGSCCGRKDFKFILIDVKMMSKGNLIKVISKEKPAQPCGFILVDHQGFEPWTPWLRVRCSASWASGPWHELLYAYFIGM